MIMRVTNFMLLLSTLVMCALLLTVVHSAPYGVDFLGQGSEVVEGFTLALPQHESEPKTYYLYITVWGQNEPIRRVQPSDISCDLPLVTTPEPQDEVFHSLQFAIPSAEQTGTSTFTTTCTWPTVSELFGATHAHIMVSKVQLSWARLDADLTSEVYTAISQWAPPPPSDEAAGFVMTTPLGLDTPIPIIGGEDLPILTRWNGTWAHMEYSPHPHHVHIPQQEGLRFKSSQPVLSAPLFQCFAVIYTANSGIVLRQLATRDVQSIDDDFFYEPLVSLRPDEQDLVVRNDAYAYTFHCYAGIRPLATDDKMDLGLELSYSKGDGMATHVDSIGGLNLPTPSRFIVENTYTPTTITPDLPTYFANDQVCAPKYVFTSPTTLYPGEAFVFGAADGLVGWLNVTAECKFEGFPYLDDVFTPTYDPAVGARLVYTPTDDGWPQTRDGVPRRAVHISPGTSIQCYWQWPDPFGDQNYPPAVPLADTSLYMFFHMARQHTIISTATIANIFDVSAMSIYSRWDTKKIYTQQPPVLSVVVDLGGFVGHLSNANEYTILTFSTRATPPGNDPPVDTAVLDWTAPLSEFPFLGSDPDYRGLIVEYQRQQYSTFLNASFSFHLSTPYNPAVNNGRDVRRFQVAMMFRGGLGEQGGTGFGALDITIATPSGDVLKYIPPPSSMLITSSLPNSGDVVDPPRNHSLPMMTYVNPLPTTLMPMGSAVHFDVKWVLDKDCFYYGDAVRFSTPDSCLEQIKCDGNSVELMNNVIRLTAHQTEPIQCPTTTNNPIVLEMQCNAIVSSFLHSENVPTQCRMGVGIAAQRFSARSIAGGEWGVVTQSVDAPSLPGVLKTSYSWLCQHPHTFVFYPCDAVELETVKDYPCATAGGQIDACSCDYSFQPECRNQQHQVGPDMRIRGTVAEPIDVDEYCDVLAKPQPRTITVNYIQTHCATCRKNTDTLYQWGHKCDISPQIINFTYAPRGATPNDPTTTTTFDVTYNDTIELSWLYSGSPMSQITIYAQSAAFSPFKTLTIATLPVARGVTDTTPVVIDKIMRYNFVLQKLPYNGEISDLIFFIVIGQDVTTFTSTPTPQQPMLHVYPRCLKANGDSMCQNAAVGTDGCNRQTGVCECDKSSVWQRGDYCELSICSTLQCVAGHTLPEVCTMVSSTPSSSSSSPSASPTFTPQCACDTTRYGGARCETTLQCQDFYTSSSCPTPKGFPNLIDNTTTIATADSCECTCNGHWGTPSSLSPTTTTFCSTCQRRCLNGGVDYGNCFGSCTCPTTGSAVYFGETCGCKGIILTMNLPIDSAKFEFIRQKKQQVNLLLTQAQTAQQQQQQQQQDNGNGNNDLLQFFQRDSFTGFVTSLLQVVVVQHRNVLITSGLSQQSDADLYQLDPITNEYSVTSDGVQKMASLLNFDVQSKEIKDTKNKNVVLYIDHFVNFKILIKPAQCIGAQGVVNDTTWMHMLEDIHMVATYLDANDITFGRQDGAGKNTTTSVPKDLIQVEDLDCQGQYCIDHPKKSNGASGGGVLSHAVFVVVIVVFTILSTIFIL